MIRGVYIAVLGFVFVAAGGCGEEDKERAFWDDVKIGELREPQREHISGGAGLKTANFDVHIYEIPAENVGKLDDVWGSVYERGVRFYSFRAFSGNLFRAGVGKKFNYSGIGKMLGAIGGRRMAKVSVLLPEGVAQELNVTGLGRPEEVSFFDRDMSREKVVIGPGSVGLRMIGRRAAGEVEVCQLIGYPVFGVPVGAAEGPMAERAKRKEVEFKGAGFGLKMSVGDYLVLGPRKYLSERVTLPGLFFSNLDGTLFFERGRRPVRKPSARVFVVVCTGIGY